jgi:hypothetical protein
LPLTVTGVMEEEARATRSSVGEGEARTEEVTAARAAKVEKDFMVVVGREKMVIRRDVSEEGRRASERGTKDAGHTKRVIVPEEKGDEEEEREDEDADGERDGS